jgi:SAM-dependent methyltransferase
VTCTTATRTEAENVSRFRRPLVVIMGHVRDRDVVLAHSKGSIRTSATATDGTAEEAGTSRTGLARTGHHAWVANRRDHWQEVYGSTAPERVSWYEPEPSTSLRLVCEQLPTSASVVDVGAGTGALVDGLLSRGFDDLTVLDISRTALEDVRARLGERATSVDFLECDVLSWKPERRFDLWHDRALFHFMTEADTRSQYVRVVEQALSDRGVLVLATFAEDGPERCSGLPVMRYSARALADAFPLLRTVRSERVEHVTPNGMVQPFTYAVLRR